MITTQEFEKLMHPFLPLPSGKLIVAVSGGVDSLALSMLLHEWVTLHKKKLMAVTVDHQLRRSSAMEAAWVKKLMKKKGIDHHIITLTPPQQKTGLPAWARAARYEAIEKFGIEHGANSLFLAHHQDDQIETILMRLMRESHWRGLSGMYPERAGLVMTYFRPLLGIRKRVLAQTLERFGVTESVADPTNEQKKQGRGFIRNVFLPNLKHLGFQDKLLFKLGQESLALRKEEDKRVHMLLIKKVQFSELGFAKISVKAFEALDDYVKGLLLGRVIDIVGAPRFPLNKASFEGMMHHMPGEGTLGNCRLTVHGDHLYILRETRNYPSNVEIEGKGVCFFQGRFVIAFNLRGKKKYTLETLGKQRFLNFSRENEGIREEIHFPEIYFTLPCLTYLDELVSIPHLCYSRDSKLVMTVESVFLKRLKLQDQRKGQS